MIDLIYDPQAWIALASLTAMEVVLGIDNIVLIAVVVGRLPEQQRKRARQLGLSIAMGLRIALLGSLAWLSHLSAPLFVVFDHAVSARDLVLFAGGVFLIGKATHEIHVRLEGSGTAGAQPKAASTFGRALVQIAILDLVFSVDSVITALGMAQHIPVMVVAIVLAVLFMMAFAGPVGDFVDRHPTVKMLALSFLVLIGTVLVADAFHQHVPRGYIYFAMGFSVLVEALNLRAARRRAAA